MDLTVAEKANEREGFFLVEFDRFQGPLDLLLHLIRSQDIDIFEIPISTITKQFLKAIRGLAPDDLDGAGEFLEMAATLIRIKAQMLLPRSAEEEEGDPRAELVRRLLEYEQIREISLRLRAAEADRGRRFGKGYIPPRPKIERCDITPKVPGSRNTGFESTGISSATRVASLAAAPTMVRSRNVTKKKCLILGGSPAAASGPDSLAQSGRTASSRSLAISVVVFRL